MAFQKQIQQTFQSDESKMLLSTALLIDGVNMFYQVIQELDSFPSALEAQSLDCQDNQAWKFGYTIANQIKGVTIRVLQEFFFRKMAFLEGIYGHYQANHFRL